MKEGWTYKKVGDVFKTYSGGTPIKSHKEYYENGDIPWIRSGEVCRKYITECEMFITQAGLENSSAKFFPIDTILVAMYGATAAQVGILKIKATSNQAVCGILPNENFIPEFVYYWFKLIESDLASQAQGGAQPNISQEKIKKVDFPIISLSEQERIVERLDAAFAQIDELKSNAERQLAEARALFQSALTQAMQPKPGWQEKKMGQICKIERGGSPRPIKQFITDSPDGVNWIKIGDTDPQGKYIFSTKEKIKPEGIRRSRWVEENDFLLSNSMSFGRPYILKTNGCIHDGWLVLRDYQESLDIDFFYNLLTSSIVQKQFKTKAQGSTVSNLNTDRVADVTVCYPSIDQQKTIASHLDALSSHVKELEEISRKTAAECDAMKQALLRQIFE